MGAGRITRVVRSQTKKKVLSNKALTKRVRSLSKIEGARIHGSALLYSAVTLTAGTADINYFNDVSGLFNDISTNINHYFDVHIKLLAAAQSTVRILYCYDEHWDGTNLISTEILDTATNSVSPYLSGLVNSYKESKNKNRDEEYRCVVVRDMLIALEAGVPKAFNVRLPLFNRKNYETSGINHPPYLPFILAMANQTDATFSMGVNYMTTDLNA